VVTEELPPSAVSELGGTHGRIDDVGEQDGGQDSVCLRQAPVPGEELFDLAEDGLGVALGVEVIRSGQLHQPRPRDVLGEVAPVADRDAGVVRPVEHQRGDAHGRKDVPNVDLHRHPGERNGAPRTHSGTLRPQVPVTVPGIVGHAGRGRPEPDRLAPPPTFVHVEHPGLGLLGQPPRIVRGLGPAGVGAVQHECRRSIGMGRRKEGTERPALR
jgi:hypothetical protein